MKSQFFPTWKTNSLQTCQRKWVGSSSRDSCKLSHSVFNDVRSIATRCILCVPTFQLVRERQDVYFDITQRGVVSSRNSCLHYRRSSLYWLESRDIPRCTVTVTHYIDVGATDTARGPLNATYCATSRRARSRRPDNVVRGSRVSLHQFPRWIASHNCHRRLLDIEAATTTCALNLIKPGY